MAKSRERNRTPRQRRRFRARSANKWLRIRKKRAEARCHYCQQIMQGKGKRQKTSDHIVPRSMWFGTTAGDRLANRVDACWSCNQKKANTLPVCSCKKCYRAMQYYRRWQKRWLAFIDGLDDVA